MAKALSYKPSSYYFRTELHAAQTREETLAIGLHVIDELERLKAWTRGHGLIPPKWFITPSERAAKAMGSVIPFPSTAPESETAG